MGKEGKEHINENEKGKTLSGTGIERWSDLRGCRADGGG